MKLKYIILYSLIFFCSMLNATSVFADLSYYKYNDKAIIHVDNISENDILIKAQYENKVLLNVSIVPLNTNTYNTEKITLMRGVDYNFFIWNNIDMMKPECGALNLNISSPNIDEPIIGDDYTKPY